ncbi:MAG: DUF4388 domain-containing protein [Myxococcales bacterium]|nr:DUF4388 domain-containing protein [Myxococcales bacterium]
MAQPQPTLLLKGSFDSFSIDDVLDVVGLSRQTMKVVLNDDGSGGGGEFLVKAGRVIHAEAPPDRGRRAFVNIYREPGSNFAVWQHVEATGEPIGMLADLIEEAKALETAPALPSRTPMLSGSFSDHRLDEVLDVLNMTRQLVEFKIRRDDESSVIMLIKAGQVLACEDLRDSSNGLPAFRSLFKDPGQTFEVVRLDARQHGDLPPSVGSLSALVQEARKTEDQDAKKRPGVLFQGAFKNFPLSDVLEALSVTRLTVEMVFHDGDGTRGTFVLKAGQVLAAQSLRTGASHAEAFHELMQTPGESFVVVRRPGTPSGEPIGRLRDLLSEKRSTKSTPTPPPTPAVPPVPESTSSTQRITNLRPARSVPTPAPRTKAPPAVVPPDRTRRPTAQSTRGPAIPPPVPTTTPKPGLKPKPVAAAPKSVTPLPRKSAAAAQQSGVEIVLDGTFDAFSIDDVLAVLGLSRQYIALATLRNGAPLARIVVKAGRLLMASYGSTKEPIKALQMLLAEPGTEFRVRRLPRYSDTDLGSFADMLEEAKRAKDASTVIHLPQPTKAPEPALPDIGEVDVDDLFAEVEEVSRIEVDKHKAKPATSGRPLYQPPEAKLRRTDVPEIEVPSVPEAKAAPVPTPPEFKAPTARVPEVVSEPELEAPEAEELEAFEPEAPEAFEPEAPEAFEPEAEVPEVEAPRTEVSTPAVAAKAVAAVAPVAASPAASEAVAQSLAVIEERLRGSEAVSNEEAVAAMKKIGTHVADLNASVAELSKHMAKMSEQMVAEARNSRMALALMQVAVLLGIIILLWKAL